MNKEWVLKKFTLPNVKEGSIIEYEYKVSSEYVNHVTPWHFQDEIPTLWSEFTFSAPQFFTYSFLKNGYQNFHSQDRKDAIKNFAVTVSSGAGIATTSDVYNFSAGVSDYRWVMKDVPPMVKENYTSTVKKVLSGQV